MLTEVLLEVTNSEISRVAKEAIEEAKCELREHVSALASVDPSPVSTDPKLAFHLKKQQQKLPSRDNILGK